MQLGERWYESLTSDLYWDPQTRTEVTDKHWIFLLFEKSPPPTLWKEQSKKTNFYSKSLIT